MNTIPNDPRDPEFLGLAEAATRKSGHVLLDDTDLLLLACEEISRTFTREEIGYAS